MIKCIKCKGIIKGNSLPSKCKECGNEDLSLFIRIDNQDINLKLYKRDKEWLESCLIK